MLNTRRTTVTLAGLLLGAGALGGCGPQSPAPSAASTPLIRGCAKAVEAAPKAFGGMTLTSEITTTVAQVDSWRSAQNARIGSPPETLAQRFPDFRDVAAGQPMTVCVFTHAARPIPGPPSPNRPPADATRFFVRADGVAVTDAIGPSSVLLAEVNALIQP